MTPTNSLERIVAMWENRAAGHVQRIRELEAELDEWRRHYTDLGARVQAAEARTRELEAALADLGERGTSLEARYREAVEQARIALAEAREAATFYQEGMRAATEYAEALEARLAVAEAGLGYGQLYAQTLKAIARIAGGEWTGQGHSEALVARIRELAGAEAESEPA